MNTSQNVISIKPAGGNGRGPAIIFRAPADKTAAFALFEFLVANLKSGFLVELDDGDNQISWMSGAPLPSSTPQ